MQFFSLMLLMHASFLCIHGVAQPLCSGTYSGIVVDEHGQPIVGAAIVLFPTQQGQTSDAMGQFNFTGLCRKLYTVKVQFLGYKEESFELRVNTVDARIVLQELVTQLDEVVIRHHDAAHTESATNFTEMDEKQLAEAAGKSLGEAMREMSGVSTLQTGPGIFKPVIHGVHSQRILILNNGIRQEGQQWGAEHAPEIDPSVAANVVVIKDASAIKYGGDALGGTVIVNPAELPVAPGINGSINSIFQTNGRSATLSGMVEGGLARHEGWGWRLQSSAKRAGDFNTAAYNLTNTGIRELNFSAAVGYHKVKAGFDLYFSRFGTEIGILKGTAVGNLDDLVAAMERPEPLYTSSFSYAISEPRQQVSHNLIKLNGHLTTSRGEWRVQYGFQNNNRQEFDKRIGQLSKLPAMDLRLNTHTIDAEWENLHHGEATFTFGINTILQDNENVPGTQRIPFIPNYLNVSAGVFGVTKIQLDSWTLDAGLRYDYRHYDVKGYDFKNELYSSSFNFANLSGTIGATWNISTTQMLRFNGSSAWRPPHVAELYSLGTHQSAASIEYGLLLNDATNEVMDLDDVNFNPEQAFKFVTTYSFNRLPWALEVSPYANFILNYTYLRPTGLTRNSRGVYPYLRNTQTDALFIGADVTANWQATRSIRASATASLLHASDVKANDYLVFIPSNRYNFTLRYEKPAVGGLRNLYAESKLYFVTRQSRAPRVVTVSKLREAQRAGVNPFEEDDSNFDFMEAPAGYILLDFAVGFSLRADKVQYDFRLASENLTNELYREYTNRFRYYADDRGRNITVSIRCIF
ncbi:MAG: TonB-dependent receptor [Chryseolinea sp.]